MNSLLGGGPQGAVKSMLGLGDEPPSSEELLWAPSRVKSSSDRVYLEYVGKRDSGVNTLEEYCMR